jgi:hypothetical protein
VDEIQIDVAQAPSIALEVAHLFDVLPTNQLSISETLSIMPWQLTSCDNYSTILWSQKYHLA